MERPYASSPVAHPADQTSRTPSCPPARSRSGAISSAKARRLAGSRKKYVSPFTAASRRRPKSGELDGSFRSRP